VNFIRSKDTYNRFCMRFGGRINERKPLRVTASKLLSSGFWVVWMAVCKKVQTTAEGIKTADQKRYGRSEIVSCLFDPIRVLYLFRSAGNRTNDSLSLVKIFGHFFAGNFCFVVDDSDEVTFFI
jgi:hypothetical protein